MPTPRRSPHSHGPSEIWNRPVVARTAAREQRRIGVRLRALRLERISSKLVAFAVLATLIPSLTTAYISYVQNRRSLSEKISQEVAARTVPFQDVIDFLDTITGVDRKAAEGTIAEIGLDMERFPTHRHLASWTSLCPGNHESAGKRKSGKRRKGNVWFRRYAIEMALAASRAKGSYLNALYHRLVRRKGHKKAIAAVAHAIVVIIYHIIKHKVPYRELGADYFDKLNVTYIKRHHLRRLESLGYKVTLEPLEAAA